MTRPLYSDVTHIEGMDLAGKSTATAYLLQASGGLLRRNSMARHNPVYLRADELRRRGAPPEDLGDLYVQALAWDLDHASLRGPGVQDSTILLRSLAFYEVLGHTETVRRFREMIPRHPRFGLTIVLTASIEARLLRLAERQRLEPQEVAPDDLMVVNQPEIFLKMERVLMTDAAEHFDAVELDTSRLTKSQTRTALDRILARPVTTSASPS